MYYPGRIPARVVEDLPSGAFVEVAVGECIDLLAFMGYGVMELIDHGSKVEFHTTSYELQFINITDRYTVSYTNHHTPHPKLPLKRPPLAGRSPSCGPNRFCSIHRGI